MNSELSLSSDKAGAECQLKNYDTSFDIPLNLKNGKYYFIRKP